MLNHTLAYASLRKWCLKKKKKAYILKTTGIPIPFLIVAKIFRYLGLGFLISIKYIMSEYSLLNIGFGKK